MTNEQIEETLLVLTKAVSELPHATFCNQRLRNPVRCNCWKQSIARQLTKIQKKVIQ